MVAAPVGDDVYEEDPTVNELEARTAALLGHEAGLYCATGSMSNLLGVGLLVQRGEEVLCDEEAHIVRAELGSHAWLHGITSRTWSSGGTGRATVEAVERMLKPHTGFLVSTGAVEIENTHNFGGGTVQDIEELRAISQLCQDRGVGRHLDGARLWNAHVKTGIPMHEYGKLFDTVSICYSKGMGAPVGSVLVSSKENIAKARNQRKLLGGGWRQAGIVAAGALYALDHNIARLADDHEFAGLFADAVNAVAPTAIRVRPETNIVVMDTGEQLAGQIVAQAAAAGIRLSAVGERVVRAVTHLDVTADDCQKAGEIVGRILNAG